MQSATCPLDSASSTPVLQGRPDYEYGVRDRLDYRRCSACVLVFATHFPEDKIAGFYVVCLVGGPDWRGYRFALGCTALWAALVMGFNGLTGTNSPQFGPSRSPSSCHASASASGIGVSPPPSIRAMPMRAGNLRSGSTEAAAATSLSYAAAGAKPSYLFR